MAVEYSPQQSCVTVKQGSEKGGCRITVCNPAEDLREEDVEYLIEPFWRKDESRTNSSEHNGLGFTLASSFAEVLGGQLCVKLDSDRRLHTTLILPEENPE